MSAPQPFDLSKRQLNCPVETIEILELLKTEIEFEYPSVYQIALSQAINELKKLIPLPLNHPQGEPLWGYCPNCNTEIYKYQNPNACKWCRQCLDWEHNKPSYNIEETK